MEEQPIQGALAAPGGGLMGVPDYLTQHEGQGVARGTGWDLICHRGCSYMYCTGGAAHLLGV